MKTVLTYIRQRLSIKLGLSIMTVVAVVFLISATFLLNITKGYVRQASIINATQILEDTEHRMTQVINEVDPDFFKAYGGDNPARSVMDDDSIGDILKRLSQIVTPIAPYPHSSSIMIGRDGTYLIHPDTAKLIRQTIFSDPDPKAREDVIPLGEAMIAGKRGMQQLVVDGNDAFVFYRPIGQYGWSMAIVCPESDVFAGYNRLMRTLWIIIGVGLLVILLFCYQTVRRAVVPLKMLERQSRHIADGHLDDILPQTTRSDSIGQLQNSFVEMQQSLLMYVNDIHRMNKDLEQRNKELAIASEQAREANEKTTVFVQDMMHQIRTPLNIISGFVQVLEENVRTLPDEETKNIITMMQDNSRKISRIARLLVASSGTDQRAIPQRRTTFSCNSLCREIEAAFQPNNPRLVKFRVVTHVPDTLTICSNKESIRDILFELLDNANKFTQQGRITLECFQPSPEGTVSFAVSDTGIGIAESDRDRIFTQFTKVNSFTEGIGLGLSLSQQTARMLGADLVLDTTYQGGARFVLTSL